MFAFKFEVRTKKCLCKNKTVQQTNSYFNESIVQSVVHVARTYALSLGRTVINGLVDDALLELSQKQLLFAR